MKLGTERELHKELNRLIQRVKNSQNGTSTMLDDTTSMYNKQYYLNMELFVGILMIITILFTLFQNK
jgi:hypothetical protein